MGRIAVAGPGQLCGPVVKAVARQHHTALKPVLARYIPRDAVVADVGGHSGQFAKLFAGMAPAGTVYTFEPGAYPRSILDLAIRLRRLKNVTLVPKGLGDKPSTLELSTPVKVRGSLRFGLAHMGKAGAPTGDRAAESVQTETVEVTTLDRFAADVGLARLDFLKADIEGWEQRMLEGGKATITKFRPVILIELVGVGVRSIQGMAARGEIPGAARFGARWTFNTARLRRWIKEREVVACQPIFSSGAKHGGPEPRFAGKTTDETYEQLLKLRPKDA